MVILVCYLCIPIFPYLNRSKTQINGQREMKRHNKISIIITIIQIMIITQVIIIKQIIIIVIMFLIPMILIWLIMKMIMMMIIIWMIQSVKVSMLYIIQDHLANDKARDWANIILNEIQNLLWLYILLCLLLSTLFFLDTE